MTRSYSFILFVNFTLLLCVLKCESNVLIEKKIREDPDLSEFYSLLEKNPVANSTLQYSQGTIFAPVNLAFQKKNVVVTEDLVLYHMCNLALTLDQLSSKVMSLSEGNPPLWITRKRSQSGREDEIFVNNAKVIFRRSNFQGINALKKKQVLHIIDRVLEPVQQLNPGSSLSNPDAFQFLNQSESFILNNHRVRSFRQRVIQNHKENIFQAAGHHTFFIPVDEGFKPTPRPDKIDMKVIDGHVIPGHVLFTEPTPLERDFETLAFGDMIRVAVAFTQGEGKQNKSEKLYVRSNTIVGDNIHSTGVVLAEIVKANIPVSNGVVHLIHRPLMVVDTTVKQFLEDSEDAPLFKFYEIVRDYAGDYLHKLTAMGELTLFAPSNSAWREPGVQHILQDKRKLMEILNLHLVDRKLPINDIAKNNVREIYQVETMARRKSLYFNILETWTNKTITVEGAGVNATIIQPNIAATNGIVHIIDRVLGVPYVTVAGKLATDPMLNKTRFLGERTGFNSQLNNMGKRYTYFVPRDYAWSLAEVQYPSAHKKLFMHEFTYHVQSILERHLVINDFEYTMAALKNMSMNNEVRLPTVRDSLAIRVKETNKGYYIEWKGESVHVFRPDVECTNGIIHVIDGVLLQDSDIKVTGAGSVNQATILSHLLSLLAVFVILH